MIDAGEFLVFSISIGFLIVVTSAMSLCFISRKMDHKLHFYNTLNDIFSNISDHGRSWFCLLSSPSKKKPVIRKMDKKELKSLVGKIGKRFNKFIAMSQSDNKNEKEKRKYIFKIYLNFTKLTNSLVDLEDEKLKKYMSVIDRTLTDFVQKPIEKPIEKVAEKVAEKPIGKEAEKEVEVPACINKKNNTVNKKPELKEQELGQSNGYNMASLQQKEQKDQKELKEQKEASLPLCC
jgi:hypothetical protein